MGTGEACPQQLFDVEEDRQSVTDRIGPRRRR
jgi:hypothetical protein